jgi:hypothetical protein
VVAHAYPLRQRTLGRGSLASPPQLPNLEITAVQSGGILEIVLGGWLMVRDRGAGGGGSLGRGSAAILCSETEE